MGYRMLKLLMLLIMMMLLTACQKEKSLSDYRQEIDGNTEELITDSDMKEYFLVTNFNEEKVKEDIITFFSIFDESSYKNAKLNLNYSEACELNEYFVDSDIVNLITEYSNKPNVNILEIERDIENTSSDFISFVITVEVECRGHYQNYFVTISYDEDYKICKFSRILLT